MKKIIVAAAILLGASSAALAQSAWTTGTATDRAAAAYSAPHSGALYDYEPGFASRQSSGLNAFAMVPGTHADSIDNPALTGGGSWGYNELERSEDQ